MKRIFHFLFVFTFISPYFLSAQEEPKKDKFPHWYITSAYGLNIPFSKTSTGQVTDYLISYHDNYQYFDLSINYFITQKWGIIIGLNDRIEKNSSSRKVPFHNLAIAPYNSNYFIGEIKGFDNDEDNRPLYQFGVKFKTEKNKLLFTTQLLLVFHKYLTADIEFYIKEKNGHVIKKISYNNGTYNDKSITIIPTVSLGYRLSKRFIASCDLRYNYLKNNFTYTRTIDNLLTGEKEYNYYQHSTNINSLNAGITIFFEFPPY